MNENEKAQLAEAPASLNFYAVTAKGFNLQITLRDTDEYTLMDRFAKMAVWLEEHKVSPKAVGQQPAAVTNVTNVPADTNGSPANVDTTVQDGSRGTAPLEKMVVMPDGKIEFYAQGFKWPFKDGRGAAVVAKLFDPATGYNEANLGQPAVLMTPGLFVDWEKPAKYYNVIRVHK